MCGLAGWAGAAAFNGVDMLPAMCAAVRHRGPDDQRMYVEPGRVGLGFRRLSVIDLEGGAQPLQDERGDVIATCNGEIYNFRVLRHALERRGHRFSTGSDAEVIVHLYEERGPDFLNELHGMFAIALWDRRRGSLLLARDRLGVKPLYWAPVEGGLLYGSEPGAIVASELVPAAPDPGAISQYLTLRYVPPPLSGFLGIRKLAPGERLHFENGCIRTERWWSLPDPGEERAISAANALDEADALLQRATSERLVADVPLGAFLSGGIDSSLVVSYMAEATSTVRTFCIDFRESGYGEGQHARAVAQRYGTAHEELVVEPDLIDVIEKTVRFAGEPFADSSAVPTYLLSGLTRRHVTVALSGDGGDEAFAGYDRYRRARDGERLAFVSRALSAVARAPQGRKALTMLPYGRRLELLSRSTHDRYATAMTHFTPADLEWLCQPNFLASAGGPRLAWDNVLALPAGRGLGRFVHLDATTYLPGDLLPKVDRMSMAHGLEVRSPLLDHRVHEFAARLPSRLKVRGGSTKWLLKELALRRGLPPDLVHRPKKGFSVPVGAWFRGPLRPWITDVLTDPRSRQRGMFRPAEVDHLLQAHLSGEEHASKLWNLCALELWHRAWIDG